MNAIENFILENHMKNVDTKYEDFAKKIMSMQSPDVFTLLFATDVHYIRTYAKLLPAYNKIKEMVEFSSKVGIDLLVLAGDIADGNTEIENQYRDIYDIMELLRRSKSTAVAVSKGNHDDCSWYAYQHKLGTDAWIDNLQWYNHTVNPLRVQYPIKVDENNPLGGYYSIDYPLQKIRVINLNTNDNTTVPDKDGLLKKQEDCSQWSFGIGEKQLNWLKRTLQFTEEGWGVIFISHVIVKKTEKVTEPIKNGEQAWEIIKGYKNKSSGKIIYTEKGQENSMEFDFTDNKSNEVVTYLFGHTHEDYSLNIDGITAIATMNLLNSTGAELCEADYTINGGWDCMLIDRKEKTIKALRYDVPKADREIKLL